MPDKKCLYKERMESTDSALCVILFSKSCKVVYYIPKLHRKQAGEHSNDVENGRRFLVVLHSSV